VKGESQLCENTRRNIMRHRNIYRLYSGIAHHHHAPRAYALQKHHPRAALAPACSSVAHRILACLVAIFGAIGACRKGNIAYLAAARTLCCCEKRGCSMAKSAARRMRKLGSLYACGSKNTHQRCMARSFGV